MTRFSTPVRSRDGTYKETKVREITQQDMMKCPHYIVHPTHYRMDGTCRCDDKSHDATMRRWGYKWKDGKWQ